MSGESIHKGKIIGYRQWFFHEGKLYPINADNYNARGLVGRYARSGLDHYGLPVETPPALATGPGMEAWEVGPAVPAFCRHNEHKAPNAECHCGFYALDKAPDFASGYVTGAITGWGEVVAHATGFRAEFAQIVALALDDQMLYGRVKEIRSLADAGGVTVCDREELTTVASEFGTPLPAEYRPAPEDVAAYELAQAAAAKRQLAEINKHYAATSHTHLDALGIYQSYQPRPRKKRRWWNV